MQIHLFITISFIIGMFFGKHISDKIWKKAFETWTEEIYAQYTSLLEKYKKESEK